MRRSVWVAVVVMLSAGFPATGTSSDAWTYHACQPFDLENGIAISEVTYVEYYSLEGVAIMTCWPNRSYSGAKRRVVQLNAAYAAGLVVSIRPGGRGLESDTLRYDLDVSKLRGFRPATGDRDSTVLVAATVECIKANVGQIKSVNYLDLRVTGQAVYEKFGGIFPLADYRCGPKVRQF